MLSKISLSQCSHTHNLLTLFIRKADWYRSTHYRDVELWGSEIPAYSWALQWFRRRCFSRSSGSKNDCELCDRCSMHSSLSIDSFCIFLTRRDSYCEMECIPYVFNKLVCQSIAAFPFMTRSIQLVWIFINALMRKLPSRWARTWHSETTLREHLEWEELGRVSSSKQRKCCAAWNKSHLIDIMINLS